MRLRLAFKVFRGFRQTDNLGSRSALLRMAIWSSALSKVAALGLQGIAIPLVYHALGQHRYALYLLITGALATITFTQFGAGPGLTQGLARANVTGSHDRESSLFNAALRLSMGGALVTGGGLVAVFSVVDPTRLFGAAFSGDKLEVLASVKLSIFALIAIIVLGVFDSALAGYQEQVVTNLLSLCGNIASAVLLIIICHHNPTIIEVMLALYGVTACSRGLSAAILLSRRSYLLGKVFCSLRGTYSDLMQLGFAFWGIQFAGMVEIQGGIYIMAHLSTPAETDIFGMAFKVLTLVGGPVAILTQPLWPAFTDAIARRDIDWIDSHYRRIRITLIIYSAIVAFGLVIAGQWGFLTVLHIAVPGSRLFFGTLGLYAVANVWTHLYYVAMMGLPGIWKVVIVAIGENLLMVTFGVLIVPHLGAAGMLLAYLSASVILPSWLLPRVMSATIKQLSLRSLSAAYI
jgi:O-antigen/teichoic acid export membrane protein